MPNMSLTKIPMPAQEPNVRNKNFDEVALGYTCLLYTSPSPRD